MSRPPVIGRRRHLGDPRMYQDDLLVRRDTPRLPGLSAQEGGVTGDRTWHISEKKLMRARLLEVYRTWLTFRP